MKESVFSSFDFSTLPPWTVVPLGWSQLITPSTTTHLYAYVVNSVFRNTMGKEETVGLNLVSNSLYQTSSFSSSLFCATQSIRSNNNPHKKNPFRNRAPAEKKKGLRSAALGKSRDQHLTSGGAPHPRSDLQLVIITYYYGVRTP